MWIPFAIPGLTPFLTLTTGDDRPALAVAGLVAVAGCFLLWLSRGKAKVGLAVRSPSRPSMTLGTDALRVDPLEEGVRASSTIVTFANANPDHPATLAADLLPCADRNKLQFELAGRAPIVPTGGDYGDGAIVGPKDWPDAEHSGLTKVPFTVRGRVAAVWARIHRHRLNMPPCALPAVSNGAAYALISSYAAVSKRGIWALKAHRVADALQDHEPQYVSARLLVPAHRGQQRIPAPVLIRGWQAKPIEDAAVAI